MSCALQHLRAGGVSWQAGTGACSTASPMDMGSCSTAMTGKTAPAACAFAHAGGRGGGRTHRCTTTAAAPPKSRTSRLPARSCARASASTARRGCAVKASDPAPPATPASAAVKARAETGERTARRATEPAARKRTSSCRKPCSWGPTGTSRCPRRAGLQSGERTRRLLRPHPAQPRSARPCSARARSARPSRVPPRAQR
jgi:hypothetical protein